MLKLITFPGQDESSNVFVQAIKPVYNGGLEKTASSCLHPDIRNFIDSQEYAPGKLYVLVNALGSGEFYGSNVNGDYFEESELTKQSEVAGHKTFLNAGVYRHHKNKNPEKSMGKVKISAYNPNMRRVELVVEIDREKASQLGHGDLVRSLDNGEHPAVSMGCKVKHDVCSICNHESKTRQDYCKHASAMMNQTLDDGRKVFVTNPNPRFFDISFVLVGADKTSFAMQKLASSKTVLSADLAKEEGLREPTKSLSKDSQKAKVALMLKRVPATAQKIDNCCGAEKKLDNFCSACKSHDLGDALTTSSSMGIVLKPREYQKIVLLKLGYDELAEDLERRGAVFAPTEEIDRSVTFGKRSQFSPELFNALKDDFLERTSFEPFISERILLKQASQNKNSDVLYVTSDILTKVSASYNGYRLALMEQLPEIVETITLKDSDLIKTINNAKFEDQFVFHNRGKSASVAPALMGVLGFGTLAYLYGAHIKAKRSAGEQVSVVDSFIEKHPNFSASMAFGLARFGAQLSKEPAAAALKSLL